MGRVEAITQHPQVHPLINCFHFWLEQTYISQQIDLKYSPGKAAAVGGGPPGISKANIQFHCVVSVGLACSKPSLSQRFCIADLHSHPLKPFSTSKQKLLVRDQQWARANQLTGTGTVSTGANVASAQPADTQ